MNIVNLIKQHRPDLFETPETNPTMSDVVNTESMVGDNTVENVEEVPKAFDYEKGYNELLTKIDSMNELINSLKESKGTEND